MKKPLFVAALLAGCVMFAFGQVAGRPVLGILPFTGGTGDDGEAIATLISMQPEILAAFTVVPRTAALNALFAEHYFQLAGLTDSDTIAGIGRMLNADYVLSGSIRRLGDRNLFIATIVNVETFEQVSGYHRTYLSHYCTGIRYYFQEFNMQCVLPNVNCTKNCTSKMDILEICNSHFIFFSIFLFV